jgi:multidrug efflux pump subunit AcrA (membrane-fusion protein)
MKRTPVIIGGVVAAVALAAGGGYAYSTLNSGVVVKVATVSVNSLSTTVNASGSVSAATSIGVFPITNGVIDKLLVEDGDQVKEGDVLAEMGKLPLKRQLQAAEANLAAAKAQHEAISWTAPTSADRSAAASAVSAAKKALSTAKSNYSSYKKLYNKADSETKKTMIVQLRQLDVARDQASAALKQAQASQQRLRITGNTALSLEAAKQAVEVAEEQVALAQKLLDRQALKAPADGVVSFGAGVEKGSALVVGVAPFTIIDAGGLVFKAAVDEDGIGAIELGQAATVTLDSAPNTPFTGKVTKISAEPATSVTGTVSYPVQISFDYGDTKVFQGMNGSTSIATETIQDALTVPVESVVSGSDGKYVFVLNADSTVTQTAVQLGAQTDTQVEISSGLSAGQQIITTGATTLQDGQQVKVS